jgi:D-serine/D-alanine/glycine transporter
MMNAFELVGSVAALIFIYIWSMILFAYLAYCKRLPQIHDESDFKMPLNKVMPYVALGFFAIVIFALSLNDNTRIALYVLPIWFLILGTFYWFKARKSTHQRGLIEDFKKKVLEQTVAAAIYRSK